MAGYNSHEASRKAESLPAISPNAIELLKAWSDEDADITSLTDRVRTDPVISSRILRVANSPYFNRGRQIGSVAEAVMVMGLNHARALIFTAALIGKSQAPKLQGFDLHYFWQSSVATAVAAQFLADKFSVKSDRAFTTGLLHHIGKLMLAVAWPQEYEILIQQSLSSETPLEQLEQGHFGLDHGSIAAQVLADWYLPEEIVTAIGEQHQAEASPSLPLSTVLKLSKGLADHILGLEGATLDQAALTALLENTPEISAEALEKMLPDMQVRYQYFSLLF